VSERLPVSLHERLFHPLRVIAEPTDYPLVARLITIGVLEQVAYKIWRHGKPETCVELVVTTAAWLPAALRYRLQGQAAFMNFAFERTAPVSSQCQARFPACSV
jgi:hypothetical protein